MRIAFALTAVLAVAGCVSAPPPPPSAPQVPWPSTPPPPPPTPRSSDWRDWPVTPGVWRYGRDERGSVAMYGRINGDALAVLRCDKRGGRVFLSVPGSTSGPLNVRTSSVARSLPVGATGGTPPYLAATLTPTDPLLDAMAFSRGRFVLTLEGFEPLVVPAWAEVGRVVEDCRG